MLLTTWAGSCKEYARWRPCFKLSSCTFSKCTKFVHFFHFFSFYLESHWQLNNVEVNIVQLQDLQGFLQRGTHQLWGVAGIPQLGRQAQAFFGCQEEQWTSWIPPTHTPSLLSFWQNPLCRVQRHCGLHPCKAEVRALPWLLSEPGAEVKTGIFAQDWWNVDPVKPLRLFFITTQVLLGWVYCKLLLNELWQIPFVFQAYAFTEKLCSHKESVVSFTPEGRSLDHVS